jgi:DNA-directed RNA polymerase subunit M/transcription elongation factor TFIIS
MVVKLKYCPHCTSELIKPKKIAQGVRECSKCKTRFFILVTSTDNK